MAHSEFSVIESLFAPLAAEANGAHGLKDDAALLAQSEYVVSKDILVADVHFRRADPLELVAKKALRVNLSDLAAKGARPIGYFLGCVWPTGVKLHDIAAFVDGLEEDQKKFRIHLYGGDTVMHREEGAPLMVSVTAFGAPPRLGVVRRDGAQIGDDIYVSGSIGDAGLGLSMLNGADKPALGEGGPIGKYLIPEPRLALGSAIAGLATATIDISDGLIADCRHIVEAAPEKVRAVIRAEDVPLSQEVADWRASHPDGALEALIRSVAAGDDYELLFTAPPSRRRSVAMASNVSKTPVARIGAITEGGGVDLLSADGDKIEVNTDGFDHFADLSA